jgi:hypothetical protein
VDVDSGDANLKGDDVLISDVLSFEVRVLTNRTADFVSLHQLTTQNSFIVHPTDSTQTKRWRIFDTWSTHRDGTYDYSRSMETPATIDPNTDLRVPIVDRILAVEITIRVWDFKTEQTRQITIIQDM